jgi:hypothetical protein
MKFSKQMSGWSEKGNRGSFGSVATATSLRMTAT